MFVAGYGRTAHCLHQCDELLLGDVEVEGCGGGPQRCPPGLRAEHQAAANADLRRVEGLVGERCLEQPVHVDAAFVRERPTADNGCSGRYGGAACAGNELGQGWKARGSQVVLTPAQVPGRHGDLGERGVAGPFPDPGDGRAGPAESGLQGGKGVGGRQPEVVVRVDLPLGRQLPGEAPQSLQGADRLEHPDGVGVAEPPYPQLGHSAAEVDQEALVGAGGVLEAHAHGGVLLEGVCHHGDGPGQHLRPVDAQELPDVQVGGRYGDVQVRGPHRAGGVHVLAPAPAPGGHGGLQVQLKYRGHRLPPVGARGRSSRLDLVHPDGVQGEGDVHGILDGEGHTGRLLAVPQRRVAESD